MEEYGVRASSEMNLPSPSVHAATRPRVRRVQAQAGRKEIIIVGSGEMSEAIEETLLTAPARAYRWLALLEEGRFNSVGELAEAVDMDPSLLRRHLALTSLMADLVHRILDGVEPQGVSLKQLLKGVEEVWG